jgi:hypothetical protein
VDNFTTADSRAEMSTEDEATKKEEVASEEENEEGEGENSDSLLTDVAKEEEPSGQDDSEWSSEHREVCNLIFDTNICVKPILDIIYRIGETWYLLIGATNNNLITRFSSISIVLPESAQISRNFLQKLLQLFALKFRNYFLVLIISW